MQVLEIIKKRWDIIENSTNENELENACKCTVNDLSNKVIELKKEIKTANSLIKLLDGFLISNNINETNVIDRIIEENNKALYQFIKSQIDNGCKLEDIEIEMKINP